MISVLVVEDDAWLRGDLTKLIAREGSGMRLAAACEDGRSATQYVRSGGAFDVALIDLGLPDGPGAEVIAALRRLRPEAALLAFTVFDDAPNVVAALKAGASGYLLKSTPFERLLPAIEEALAGGAPMTPAIVRLVVAALVGKSETNDDEPRLSTLTRRESETLAYLAKGVTYAEIAGLLDISLGTVQSYVKSIYRKLEVSSKAEAAAIAVRSGLA